MLSSPLTRKYSSEGKQNMKDIGILILSLLYYDIIEEDGRGEISKI
jgi:hypothetical protein